MPAFWRPVSILHLQRSEPRTIKSDKNKYRRNGRRGHTDWGKSKWYFFLGEENIMALKDITSKYQYTHSSFELCYHLNNRINAGQLPTGPNCPCPHKIALCLELINKKKLPLKENKSGRDPEKSSRLNLDRFVKSLLPTQISDNELFNNKLKNCISPEEIQVYLNTQNEQIVNCSSCNSKDIVPYEYNRENQCICFDNVRN